MMARATSWLMPGSVASRATAGSAGASRPVPVSGPVVPSALMPQAAGTAEASSAAREVSWVIRSSRKAIWTSSNLWASVRFDARTQVTSPVS